jgi:plastocyanin
MVTDTPRGGACRDTRSRRGRLGAVLALILLALAALGCSSKDPGPLVVPGNTPDSLAGDRAVVELSDTTLKPRVVEITEGGTVAWVNRDRTTHRLVSLAPNVFESPRLGEGETFVSTFTKPGTYPYYCSIHNEMKGTVVVYYAN